MDANSPNLSAGDLKKAIRAAKRSLLKSVTPEARAAASLAVCGHLRRQPAWREARSILFYSPLLDELDIQPLIEETLAEGKLAALPRYDPETGCYGASLISGAAVNLSPGQFGIPEPHPAAPPLPLNQLDFILVPGLAFDLFGARLGRGRGFYDRLLAGVRGVKCGLGFDEQIEPELPLETHDILLDCLVAPALGFANRRGPAVKAV